jgi:uncharacterized membrane protein YtjA (UPF0391 family)
VTFPGDSRTESRRPERFPLGVRSRQPRSLSANSAGLLRAGDGLACPEIFASVCHHGKAIDRVRPKTPTSTTSHEENPMLYYAIVFLIIALVAGFFGFFGIAGLAGTIAKILFVIFIILFIASLIFGRRPRV